MTQLALVFALGLLGLVFSFVVGQVEVKRGAVSPSVKRIESAIERAALSWLRLGASRTALLLSVPAAGLVGYALVFAKPVGAVSPSGRAVFFCVSLLAGALSALAQARFAIALGTRASSVAAAAASRGSSRSLRPLLRASGAISVFGEGLGLLGLAVTFAGLYAVRGGFAGTAANSALAAEVAGLLPAFALGAAMTALVLTREGSVLAASAEVGGSHASEGEAQLESRDPRGPATLAELLGQQVGGLIPRVLAGYVCGVTATVSAALLAVVASNDAVRAPGALGCVTLILVIRAFGVIGSICGVFAARAAEDEPPLQALFRGQLCAVLVSAFGLGAALFWLRFEPILGLFWPALAGLVSMALVSQLAWLPLRRRGSALRELTEARSLGDGAAIARSAAAGLSSLMASLLVPALALSLVQGLPALAGDQGPSSTLVLAAFAAGVFCTTPFSLAVAGFGLLCETANGVASLARLESDGRRRSARLEEAGAVGLMAASTHLSLGLATSLMLGVFSLYSAFAAPGKWPHGLALSATFAGATLVLLFGARASRSAMQGARGVSEEVERQLRGFPRQHGELALPVDFVPSYKNCVDAALGAVRQSSVFEGALALFMPFVLAGLLLLGKNELPKHALLAFAGAAVVSGLLLSLAGGTTRSLLSELRRRAQDGDGLGTRRAAVSAHAFGELFGVTAVSVEAIACVFSLTIFSLAPLLG